MRNSGQHATRRFRRSNERGFTLLELMTAVTVFGVLLAIGIPSFTETIRNNQIISQTNEFVGAMNLARSEALKRVGSVTVCPTANPAAPLPTGPTCVASNNWSTGFIVFNDANGNGIRETATEVFLQSYPATTNSIVISSPTRQFFRYTAIGMSAHTGISNFSILRSGCVGNRARNIAVSPTGRLLTTTVACP